MTPPAAALWRPPGAMVGGTSYRQLRSLRSLASGYDYVALRADDAACGGYVAPSGRHGGSGVLPPAALTSFACKRLPMFRPSGGSGIVFALSLQLCIMH